MVQLFTITRPAVGTICLCGTGSLCNICMIVQILFTIRHTTVSTLSQCATGSCTAGVGCLICFRTAGCTFMPVSGYGINLPLGLVICMWQGFAIALLTDRADCLLSTGSCLTLCMICKIICLQYFGVRSNGTLTSRRFLTLYTAGRFCNCFSIFTLTAGLVPFAFVHLIGSWGICGGVIRKTLLIAAVCIFQLGRCNGNGNRTTRYCCTTGT